MPLVLLQLAEDAATGASWTNATLHEYLAALAAWLTDAGGYYANRSTVPPGNGWEVVNNALRTATIYE